MVSFQQLWKESLVNYWNKYQDKLYLDVKEDMHYIVIREDDYLSPGSPKTNLFSWVTKRKKDCHPLVQKVIELTEGFTLDVGCGVGRISLILQQEGHEVVPIDIDKDLIAICKERGLNSASVMSLSNLAFPEETFDTVLLTANVLGESIETLEDIPVILGNIYKILKPKGSVIITGFYYLETWPGYKYIRKHGKKMGAKYVWNGITSDVKYFYWLEPNDLILEFFQLIEQIEMLSFVSEHIVSWLVKMRKLI